MIESKTTEPGGTWIGSTESSHAGIWRITMHWYEDGGNVSPAGLEVRAVTMRGDAPLGPLRDGTPEGNYYEARCRPRAPDAISSQLLGHDLKWGALIREHRGLLLDSLEESVEKDRLGAEWEHVAELVAGLPHGNRRGHRAADSDYQLCAALYREAQRTGHRGSEALEVLRLLVERYNYQLDPENHSHRQKVRAWIAEARKRGYLEPSTRTTNRKEQQ